MRVFVIGATGYAGLNVARRLADHGQDVVGLARNEADAAAEVGNGVLQANQHVIRQQHTGRNPTTMLRRPASAPRSWGSWVSSRRRAGAAVKNASHNASSS